ncbi:TPA: hypothetical protein ACP9DH_002892 [Legionella anisa]
MTKRKNIEKTEKTEPKVKSKIRELRISLGVMIKENHLELFKDVLLAEHLSNLSKPNYKIKKSLGYKKWFFQVLLDPQVF